MQTLWVFFFNERSFQIKVFSIIYLFILYTGVAFLECLDNSPENGILTSTKALPLTLELEQYRDATPPLKLIGDYVSNRFHFKNITRLTLERH